MIDLQNPVNHIVFDFDNTLFDTEALKEVFWQIAQIHGYSTSEAQSLYNEARTRGNTIVIAIDTYVAVVKEHVQADGREFKSGEVEHLVALVEQSLKLLPGAKELLTWCQKQNIDRYLISLGVANWQQYKINVSGTNIYFEQDHIIFTDVIGNGKHDVLQTIFGDKNSGESIALFNDKPDETANILRMYPKLIAFVRREKRDARYSESDFTDLEKQFPGRVVWSEKLSDLQRILETLFIL